MGLFRRGTKLLKLGSGLRDCCCRPENPEECWCPDWCRYYWDWEGNGFFPADTFLENQCSFNRSFYDFSSDPIDEFGLIVETGTINNITSAVSWNSVNESGLLFLESLFEGDLTPQNGIELSLFTYANGVISEEATQTLFGESGFQGYASLYAHNVIFSVGCYRDANNNFSLRLRAFNESTIFIYNLNASGSSIDQNALVSFHAAVEVPLASQCVSSENISCFSTDVISRHLQEEIAISFDEDNVTVNGTDYPWSFSQNGFLGLPLRTFADADSVISGYRVENKFPIEGTLTLRQKSFCIAGDCDCTESLTGMTVNFEGKTFTYGSLEQFVDGSDTWEETIPGLFRRTTRETCDGTYVAAVKIAEVFCEAVDGTDYWTVYLDSECYERDEATCPAAADARRIMQWTGVFTCGEDGKPGGTPHSANDASEPPDLDSNTTLGTPAAECAGDLDFPAISFG